MGGTGIDPVTSSCFDKFSGGDLGRVSGTADPVWAATPAWQLRFSLWLRSRVALLATILPGMLPMRDWEWIA